jgi:hypothetical protein
LIFLGLIVAGRKQKNEAFPRELPEHGEKLRGLIETENMREHDRVKSCRI